MTTPIPTLTALPGLVEALEAFASWTCPKRFSEPGKPALYGDCGNCNWCRARAALAAWRTRLPMAEDAELYREVLALVRSASAGLDVPRYIADRILDALDARMGKPGG